MRRQVHLGRVLTALVVVACCNACKAERQTPATDTRRQLESLGYLQHAEDDRELQGVTIHLAEAQPGLNVITLAHTPPVYLMENDGTVVHTWQVADGERADVALSLGVPYGDGDLIGLSFESGVLRMSWDGELRWFLPMRAHHELFVRDDGDIVTVRNDVTEVPYGDSTVQIVSDTLVTISPEGELRGELPLVDVFGDRIPESRLELISQFSKRGDARQALYSRFGYQGSVYDVFHTNSVQFIDDDTAIVCVRQLNLIAAINVKDGSIEWELADHGLQEPHHPQLLPNGNLLVYDNGVDRRFTRVLEIDLDTNEVVWSYYRPGEFFSAKRGSNQRLENGNTLIAESDTGRAFEVRPDGEIVWEYLCPKRTEGTRSVLYRVARLDEAQSALLRARPNGSG